MIIIGGGLAGLVLARELSGTMPVTLLEARGKLGGLIASEEIAGHQVDIGAESFARRDPATADYIHSLGLETLLPDGPSWIFNGEAVKMPADSSLGIPAFPDAEDVRAVIDPARALEDLTMDPSVGRDAENLAELVEARMGTEVLEKLVRPIAGSIYSADPAKLAINPDLKRAFLEHGSLTKAVESQLSGPAIESIAGGMHTLVETLAAQAEEGGADLRTNAPVTSITPTEAGYEVATEAETFTDTDVVIATDVRAAQKLLGMVMDVPDLEIPQGRPTTHVTLAVRDPQLDAAPRGSGLLCAAGTSRAKALTHLSCKWPWMREMTDVHYLRVSYALNESVPAEWAIEDAEQLLGITLGEVVDSRLVRWGGALTPSTPALRQWAASLTPPPGLHLAGAWKAGTGIAAVLAHARELAQSLGGAQ